MANFPIPYLYKNPAFWGDRRDQFYGTDFVNLPYQDKNVDSEREAVLKKMEGYISNIKKKEEALMTHLGITDTTKKVFSLAESTKMDEINGRLKASLEQIQMRKKEIQNADITQYFNTKVKQITSTTTIKTISKIILKNLFNNSSSASIDMTTFLTEILGPIQTILQQNPKVKQGAQWDYFLETQAKLLSYIIDFFKSPEAERFSNSSWYSQYHETVLELEEELRKAGKKRKTRDLIRIDSTNSKFTITVNQGESQVSVNMEPLQKSVTASLEAFTRKDFPKMVEEMLTKGLGGEHTGSKGFSGGKVYNFEIALPDMEFFQELDESEQLQQQLIQSKTKELLQLALRGRRTVKSDIFLETSEGNFGISVKTGQQDETKLDTRSNYFTFINFVSQYSPAIAESLLQPQNQHILINIIASKGTFKSSGLNQVLNMIAYAFFGANGDPYINAQTGYFNEIGERYSENVLIINEDGICTRVSTYLDEIYQNLSGQATTYSLKTIFSGTEREQFPGTPPPIPHPADEQLYAGVNYLKDIAVETYIKTYHL